MSVWSVWAEHMSCVCVGIFHVSEGWVKLLYTKTMNVFSRPDWSNIFMFLFYTVHNKITQLGIEQRIHKEKVHSNVITHCKVTMLVPSNIITHCDFTMGIPSNVIIYCDVILSGHCNIILLDLHWPDLSPFREHIHMFHIKTVHSV